MVSYGQSQDEYDALIKQGQCWGCNMTLEYLGDGSPADKGIEVNLSQLFKSGSTYVSPPRYSGLHHKDSLVFYLRMMAVEAGSILYISSAKPANPRSAFDAYCTIPCQCNTLHRVRGHTSSPKKPKPKKRKPKGPPKPKKPKPNGPHRSAHPTPKEDLCPFYFYLKMYKLSDPNLPGRWIISPPPKSMDRVVSGPIGHQRVALRIQVQVKFFAGGINVTLPRSSSSTFSNYTRGGTMSLKDTMIVEWVGIKAKQCCLRERLPSLARVSFGVISQDDEDW